MITSNFLNDEGHIVRTPLDLDYVRGYFTAGADDVAMRVPEWRKLYNKGELPALLPMGRMHAALADAWHRVEEHGDRAWVLTTVDNHNPHPVWVPIAYGDGQLSSRAPSRGGDALPAPNITEPDE